MVRSEQPTAFRLVRGLKTLSNQKQMSRQLTSRMEARPVVSEELLAENGGQRGRRGCVLHFSVVPHHDFAYVGSDESRMDLSATTKVWTQNVLLCVVAFVLVERRDLADKSFQHRGCNSRCIHSVSAPTQRFVQGTHDAVPLSNLASRYWLSSKLVSSNDTQEVKDPSVVFQSCCVGEIWFSRGSREGKVPCTNVHVDCLVFFLACRPWSQLEEVTSFTAPEHWRSKQIH